MSDTRPSSSSSKKGKSTLKIPLRGRAVLSNPVYNRGTAFSKVERQELKLAGLLPNRVSTPEMQKERQLRALRRKKDDLERYIGLTELQDRNECLFYQLLHEHIDEMLPIVYTPTVGLACQKYSHILPRTRGLWITPDHGGCIEEVLRNCGIDDVKLIVVTDNERILGLGDQGAGGMGIPIGKLALYTVGAGIDPSQCLPISLDVGTGNEYLLSDPLYAGYQASRLRGPAYDAFVEEFIVAVKKVFPNALLQWEDFKKNNAMNLLERYRKRLLCFNDDIQGTAAVGLAGVLSAQRVTGIKTPKQRVVILGAGAAGVGIADLIRDRFARDGLSGDDLEASVAVLDSKGLLVEGRTFADPYKSRVAWSKGVAERFGLSPDEPTDLLTVIQKVKPTVLIGTTGVPDTFTEPMIREMALHCDRPAVFPFSNPTANAEAKPIDVLSWTDGKALVATGSPFDDVVINDRTIQISQGNNVYIFPGVGLGALVAQATEICDSMFAIAAETVANMVDNATLETGALYPPLTQLRPISRAIAVAVAKEAMEKGLAKKISDEELDSRITDATWDASYPEIIVG
ncbi:MAG: NAD-dependent malic enzyme [Deltaproteobacteria bacterium]|nr:NAD-dependent malic enzyme [Deltaproteobacteria bacterium]